MSVMAEMLTKSFLMGLDRSTRKMEFAEPTAEEIETLSYAEAVEYLRKRDVLKKVDYDKRSAQLKFRAFTASRISDGALLKRINDVITSNVESGDGLNEFLKMTKTDVLSKVGLGNTGGWYWETVYRTNVQTAYNAGRMMGYEEDKPLALELVVIDDARTTDYCRQYAGKGFILPYDDPFWKTHIPPFHFNCRTTVRAIYDEREIPEQWSSKADIEKPAKGFGNNPVVNDSWWKELSSQVRQAKMYGVQGEIERAGIALGVSEQTRDELIKTAIEEIKKKQEASMPKKIYNYKKMTPKQKRKAICNWLIRKGMISGKERFVIAREDGSPVVFKKGSSKNVFLGDVVENFLEMADDKRFIFYHNHPLSGSFSYGDIQTLNRYPSLREMVAVGHNGTIYSMKVGKRLSDSEIDEIFNTSKTELNAIMTLVNEFKWHYNYKRG